MKHTKMTVTALVCMMALVVGGCGEAPFELTPEEQASVVYYAAHVVSKFNTRQPDGLTYVPQELLGEDTETESSPPTTEDASGDIQTEDQTTETPQNAAVSLTESLGLENLTAEFKGAELKSSYSETDYHSLHTAEGHVYLVVTIALHNSTDKDVECNMLEKQLAISAIVNETMVQPAMTTFLLDDLGIYQGTIEAGQTVNTVLLFEFPDNLTKINGLNLEINHGGGVVKQTGIN